MTCDMTCDQFISVYMSYYVSPVTGWMAISEAIAILLDLKQSALAFLGDLAVNRVGSDSNVIRLVQIVVIVT